MTDFTTQNQPAPDAMVRHFLGTMLWAENDNSDETGGQPLDSNYDLDDVHESAWQKAREVCAQFLAADNGKVRVHLEHITPTRIDGDRDSVTMKWELAGHDLWLTSQGHGAGFWDGDWPEGSGDYLSEHARAIGEMNPFVENGTVYLD